ncbi:DNA alkylation repair protein [Massilia sp. TS11]|uniref:DNA alkylation repair protein n=1 Tax=Massilia sp. TS11 TaxID=2908003 RepID=UPI001ED9E56F|nr:DNA alkylation repair protein [Massilia sp. TS11]MCG2584697.1 DNA alkylation repair protein [Massilia sp. TS11]
MPIAHDILAALQPLADPERAAPMRAYMKGKFPFFGIPTPARRAALAPILKRADVRALDAAALLALARRLWERPERECQYAAIDLLARHWKRLGVASIPAVLELSQQRAWWDSVDGLAGVVNDILHAERSGQVLMDAAIGHANLWVRRTAMIHQLGWRADTDTDRLSSYSRQLAGETDFFIRKAIGWALRDYAHHNPPAVAGFLQNPGVQFAPLTVREASKHLGKYVSLA